MIFWTLLANKFLVVLYGLMLEYFFIDIIGLQRKYFLSILSIFIDSSGLWSIGRNNNIDKYFWISNVHNITSFAWSIVAYVCVNLAKKLVCAEMFYRV